MALVYIPEVGTTVKLLEDWTFAAYYEGRNHQLINIVFYPGKDSGGYYRDESMIYGAPRGFVTLPKDTELKVDRIYVRKNKKEYSSITFKIVSNNDTRFCTLKPAGKRSPAKWIPLNVRFWTKLADTNSAKMEVIHDPSFEEIEFQTAEEREAELALEASVAATDATLAAGASAEEVLAQL